MERTRSTEVLADRFPVVRFPAGGEVLLLLLGERVVVEDQPSLGTLGAQLEPRDRIGPGRPSLGAPGLDDELVWYELEVAPRYVSAKGRECRAFGRGALGRGP